MQQSEKQDKEAIAAVQQLPLHTHEASGWSLEPPAPRSCSSAENQPKNRMKMASASMLSTCKAMCT